MAKEIERKYLIDLSLIGDLGFGTSIKQGYISSSDNTVVRIRLSGDVAFLTLKGENTGVSRSEFEYSIPPSDASEIIKELCSGPVVEKTRYLVEHSGHTWEIDIFHGENDGLIVAEIELQDVTESYEIPNWVVREVSGETKYYNSNLLENPFKNW